ncbi:nedd8-activating enzyme E1 regulatory subunit isoform X2 [Teleopsis dalmanni]|uniref:nedd8-activating enzyme E1 regulatory subunit isoform X2 n=1 Tax=Teleopsis dalmanni TaxID=139649 RepID=UPI0018CECFB8|nr:nedd8-activating enzyme E1 regulatory subunit isoform X2 [Teleopsis dalmanni]
MSSPAPKSPDQSDKSKKYDRQIRLWGDHGQALLESAKVCLVNATAVGCEALKGIVLPGIGGFTIVDGSIVTEDDLGVNFFLDSSYLHKSKAMACMRLVVELNPDVSGDYVDESIEYILSNRPAFFETFDVVVASNLSEQILLELSNTLWKANVPFIYCRSLGFFGSIRLQFEEHCVIEAHPDNQQTDLRLEEPFALLKQHIEHTEVTSKVPWLLVLNKYLNQYRALHNNETPKNYKQKSELRELIRSGMSNEEENHEEAIKAVNTAFGGGIVTKNLKEIFDDDSCENLNKQSDNFWIIAKALKDFVIMDNNGFLPVPGVLPDMTANTESYINLQNVYRQQALQDADNVYRKCQTYLKDLGLPEEKIDEKSVRLFCREAANVAFIRGTNISNEYEKNTRILAIEQDSFTEQYIALRAYESFLTEYGSIPGECNVENDVPRLKSIASKLLGDWGSPLLLRDDIIHEICHYGGSEVHSISAFIGGCAAQEVIKIITKQFKPVNNTFLYNGITSDSVTITL